MMKRQQFNASELRILRKAPQHTTQFRIGDRVQLASGGPSSLIVDVDGSGVTMAWLTNDGPHEMTIRSACVIRDEPIAE